MVLTKYFCINNMFCLVYQPRFNLNRSNKPRLRRNGFKSTGTDKRTDTTHFFTPALEKQCGG